MEILFRQKESADNANKTVLCEFGIKHCILKHICFDKDRTSVIKKRHYHMSAEIHIIEKGYQTYEINDKTVRVSTGQFLFIKPTVKHLAIDADPKTEKHAITFALNENSKLADALESAPSFALGASPSSVPENINRIYGENKRKDAYSYPISASRAFECAVSFFRAMGVARGEDVTREDTEESARLLLAKQYVEDNIYRRVSVCELSSYCCISQRQLERIFKSEAGMSVMEYVRKTRCAQIEKMLLSSELSLSRISEKMSFNNEYHFNSFFKKYSGMSPGAYRKTARKC